MSNYIPEPVPRDQKNLQEYLNREFLRISTAVESIRAGQDWTDRNSPGIKLWQDEKSSFSAAKVTGASQPSWTAFRSNIYAYEFSASTMNEGWIAIHINHDYAPGTAIYPHIHWSQTAASPSGTVRWGIEYSIAKGHGQEAFPATTTVYIEQDCTAQYQHMIAEVADPGISSDSLEIDSLILFRIFRDAAHGNDDSPDTAFVFFVDIHYQADRPGGSLSRSPDFYSR